MGDKIPRVLSYSSSDYSQDLSLLIIRQTGPGGDDLGQIVWHRYGIVLMYRGAISLQSSCNGAHL